MIPFTDVTGLASSAIAIIAVAVMLPGVARLQRFHFALLICAIVIVILIPFDELPLAAYVRGVTGDLSITSLVLLILTILRPLFGCPPSNTKAKLALQALITIAALGLYPMALGICFFDPYRLGYGNPWFVSVLLLVALAACFRQLPAIALIIALAVFAWSVGWYESTNLWDYLLDPLLAIYTISTLIRHGARVLLK